ncbi:MAG TPA: hypothetical protein VLT35_04000 [Methanocella sp.]|nr:hypothetical protein [Methanocella sp.]
MRKKLNILAILVLSVAVLALIAPAASVACSPKKPTVTPVPITIPDGSFAFLDNTLNGLAAAIAAHDDAAIARILTTAEQQVHQAIPDTDNLKVKVKANTDAKKLTVQVLATQASGTGHCSHAKTIELLKVVVKVRQTDDGVTHIGVRIKGGLTDQQKASLTALVQAHQGQLPPNVVIDLKFK